MRCSPLLTGHNELMLAEFKYGGVPKETFAPLLGSQDKPSSLFYWLKKDIFPLAYWNAFVKVSHHSSPSRTAPSKGLNSFELFPGYLVRTERIASTYCILEDISVYVIALFFYCLGSPYRLPHGPCLYHHRYP